MNVRWLAVWVLCSWGGLGSVLSAAQLEMDLDAELAQLSDSVTLDINKRGFSLLSQYLTSDWAADGIQRALPDNEFVVAPLTRVKVEEMTANLQLDDIKVMPSEQGLRLNFVIKNLDINIGKLTLRNYFFPKLTRPTVCQDTHIILGHKSPLPVYSHIGSTVTDDHRLALELAGIDFTLQRSQYKTVGPKHCVGAFGMSDHLSQFVVRRVLSMARSRLAKMMTAKVEGLMPKLAGVINQQLSRPLPLNLPDLYLIPGARLQFLVQPNHLHTDDERLRLSLGITVSRAPADDEAARIAEEAKEHSSAATPPLLAFASLGVNPELINHVFAALFKNGSRAMELPAAMHPRLGELLQVSELSFLWPDLTAIKPEADRLRLFMNLNAAPVLKANAAMQQLSLQLPDLGLRYQVRLGGKWRDYFLLRLNLQLPLGLQVDHGTMGVNFLQPVMSLTGGWAPNYQPTDPSFDASTTTEVLTAVLSYALSSVSPMMFDLPPFAAGDSQFSADNFRIEDPFMVVDFVDEVLTPLSPMANASL